MNKFLFVSSAIVTSIVFSQAVFADTNLQLSKDDLIAASNDYILTSDAERPAARRSSLFAHILGSQTGNVTTMASADEVLVKPEG